MVKHCWILFQLLGQRTASIRIFSVIFQNKLKYVLLVIFWNVLRAVFLTIFKLGIEVHYYIWQYFRESGLQALDKCSWIWKERQGAFPLCFMVGYLSLRFFFCLFMHLLFLFLLLKTLYCKTMQIRNEKEETKNKTHKGK